MLNRRWWDLAALAVAAVTVLFGLVDPPYGPDDRGAWAVAAVFVVVYFAYLRGRIGDEDATQHTVIIVVLTVIVGTGVAFDPAASILQAFAYPFLWITAPSTRRAVAGSVAIALALFVGYVVHGWPAGWLAGLAIAALSLGFSLALGLWITHIASIGEERMRLFDELQAAQGQLAAMHREAGVNEERGRLAREIHDTIAQSLTGLVMVAQRADNRLAAIEGAPAAAARIDVELIEQMAREALTEARGLVASLAPVAADGGLTAALGRLGQAFERETGVRVEVESDATGLDRELEVVLLRCAQEGLANVRKHARASTARVAVSASGHDGEEIVLTVRDDGVGPDPEPGPPSGFGLAGLRDRAALVGGSFEFGAAPGGGALLRITVPKKEQA